METKNTTDIAVITMEKAGSTVFACGTIPIYWCAPEIGEFFDAAGMIQVSDLQSMLRIVQVAQRNGKDIYNMLENVIKANQNRAREYAVCEDWMFRKYPRYFK